MAPARRTTQLTDANDTRPCSSRGAGWESNLMSDEQPKRNYLWVWIALGALVLIGIYGILTYDADEASIQQTVTAGDNAQACNRICQSHYDTGRYDYQQKRQCHMGCSR